MLPWLLSEQLFFYQFINNLYDWLLCKFNVLEIFSMTDYSKIFVVSRRSEILMESNFWLRMYVRCILKFTEDYKRIRNLG